MRTSCLLQQTISVDHSGKGKKRKLSVELLKLKIGCKPPILRFHLNEMRASEGDNYFDHKTYS